MIRINTVFPKDMVEKLDSIAMDRQVSRSMLLREAAEKLIEDYMRAVEEKIRKERIKKAIALQDRLRRKSGGWNGVLELRKWRERSK